MLGLLLFARAYGLPADLALSQLHHTQWTIQSGVPSDISFIVQTRDGYIWMAANGRLFRFDGVEFERVERVGAELLPSERVYSIWAPPGGGLWISYLFGGATFIGDGTVRHYSLDDGLPPNSIRSFAQDSAGYMWAGTGRGLLRLEAGRWSFVHDAWEIPEAYIEDMQLDREGTLWVVTADGVFYLRRGSRRFELGLQLPVESWMPLISSPDGVAWLARSDLGITELYLPAPGTPVVPRWRARGVKSKDGLPSLLIDRDSNLWLSDRGTTTRLPLSRGEGAAPGSDDSDIKTSGYVRLAGEAAGPMLEDREGNIWAVSSGGLDRFRASAFVNVSLADASYGAAPLAAAEDGSVWIGTSLGNLHRFEGTVEREVVRSPIQEFGVLHSDHEGTLWVGSETGSIHHRRGDRWIEWRPDDAKNARGIQAIVSQPDGTMWISIVGVGVYRVSDNRWTLWGGLTDLPREPATMLALDPNGRVWLGYINSRIAVVDQDRVTVYDAADGLSTGAVQVIALGGQNIWVGGEKELNWFDGHSFHSVQGDEKRAFANVSGILEKAEGDLWLNTSDGAALIPVGEVRRFVTSQRHRVRFRLFNHLDGMPGAAALLRPLPTAVESTDGRIWFSTTKGVVSLAPRWPAPNPIVPDVFIKSITVDGTRTDVDTPNASALQLSSNAHVLQINYTALSFAIPERVRFKYQLEGSDMGWQDVGTRRQAHFTGLPPGSYRFQVIASNDSGVWNENGASLEFVIPPTFLQSREFKVICVAAGAAALWLLFVLRMRQVKAQLQSHNEERLLERERIARELHDTFLQGVQGLVLRFQSAAERIPEDAPARKLMEDALDRADRVLAEGRDKVSELRASVSSNLPEALKMVGNELSHDYAVSFHAEVEGAERELNPLVQEEALRIATEALTNAFRHARATRISTSVLFGRGRFEIRVVDDGSGFDVTHVQSGRWGLQGIRERAERIRGKIVLSSQPGVGTTVELHIPAKLAYQSAAGTRWNWGRSSGVSNTEKPT